MLAEFLSSATLWWPSRPFTTFFHAKSLCVFPVGAQFLSFCMVFLFFPIAFLITGHGLGATFFRPLGYCLKGCPVGTFFCLVPDTPPSPPAPCLVCPCFAPFLPQKYYPPCQTSPPPGLNSSRGFFSMVIGAPLRLYIVRLSCRFPPSEAQWSLGPPPPVPDSLDFPSWPREFSFVFLAPLPLSSFFSLVLPAFLPVDFWPLPTLHVSFFIVF